MGKDPPFDMLHHGKAFADSGCTDQGSAFLLRGAITSYSLRTSVACLEAAKDERVRRSHRLPQDVRESSKCAAKCSVPFSGGLSLRWLTLASHQPRQVKRVEATVGFNLS